MKRKVLTLTLLFALLLTMLPQTFAGDVIRCSDWAREYIEMACSDKLVPDVLNGADLRQQITRAEFAAVAVRLYEALTGTDVPLTQERPFSDTDDAEVLRAYSLGIVNGIPGGRYQPEGGLTREQATTMLGRVCEKVLTGEVRDGGRLRRGGAQFQDDQLLGDWSRNYVYYFVGKGVINGVGNGNFAPKDNMTREQALKVTVLSRLSLSPGDLQEDPDEQLEKLRQSVLDLVNGNRAANGKRALTLDDKLCQIAQQRAWELTELFSHTRPDGTKVYDLMGQTGVRYWSAGENIAAGQRSPEEVMDSWMNSPGHRANILNGNYDRLGVGVVHIDGGYLYYWVQVFAG